MPERQTHGVGTLARPMLHPLHAILLAFPIALFTGALVADIAYLRTAELQWSNFAGWMITGALVAGGVVLLWALVSVVFARRAGRMRAAGYLLLIVIMWAAGLVNAFQHSRDGWSAVGALGLLLSLTSTLSALVAGWIGFSALRRIVR
jgi:uncharacterized membrane protein